MTNSRSAVRTTQMRLLFWKRVSTPIGKSAGRPMRNCVRGSKIVRGKKKRRNIRRLAVRNPPVSTPTRRRRDLMRASSSASSDRMLDLMRSMIEARAVSPAWSSDMCSPLRHRHSGIPDHCRLGPIVGKPERLRQTRQGRVHARAGMRLARGIPPDTARAGQGSGMPSKARSILPHATSRRSRRSAGSNHRSTDEAAGKYRRPARPAGTCETGGA